MTEAPHTTPAAILVIGYGNTLREDDGAGVLAAERIEALALPGVSILICAQLSPEHVALIADVPAVVFVDASIGEPHRVRLARVEPSRSSVVLAHALEPATALALARDVYARVPDAWLLTVPAYQLGFGEALSSAARRGAEEAVALFTRTFRPGRA